MTQQTSNQTARKPSNRYLLGPFLAGFLLLGLILFLLFLVTTSQSKPMALPVVAISSQNMSQVVEVRRLDQNSLGLFAWSPDSRVLAIGYERTIDLWNVDKGYKINSMSVEYFNRDMAFSPDGTKLAVGRGSVTLYDVASGREIQTFNGNVGNIAFSPDGAWLAGGMRGGKAIIWDASNGKELSVFSDPLARPGVSNDTRPAFSPDGKMLALGSPPRVTIWDMETGSLLSSLWADTYRVIRFMADGKMIATDNGILDIITGEPQARWKFIGVCGSISPDGSVLAFYNLPPPDFSRTESGPMIKSLRAAQPDRQLGPSVPSCPIVFSPDGRLLVFGSSPVSLWGVAP